MQDAAHIIFISFFLRIFFLADIKHNFSPRFGYVLLLLSVFLLISACGNKGPLTLPKPDNLQQQS